MNYAFVGLGHLGRPLAMSLRRAGFPLAVHDLDAARAEPLLAAGAAWAEGPAAAARQADALITCLPSPAASAAVLEAALPALRPGAAWIEMSTNDFPVIAALAAKAAARGVDTLACPVTGGVHKAVSGEIAILAGGPQPLFERHRPALEAMGGAVIRLGGLEQAAVTKVVTNMLAFIHLIAAGEALMLCARAGVDLGAAFAAIRASSGNSFVHETESQVILNGSYDIGFTMDLACKDAGFAMEIGRRLGVPLKLAGLMEQTFIEGRARYGGGAWSSMIVRLLEDATGTPLRAPGFPARLGEGTAGTPPA
ncbi:NAD(P)-dependent oxidoreductase [Labrys wisconsinensis]|uniref:3-hydroxyisobutyrate dehydrogenase n=1 Tax=Labrys wisconsinensis TaxID=425677 RepID=A0ABU0JKB3_9HYPH|nr:NAD(P)-dependent oxidoreductase [Labrys wisconsinensis]MDQ0474723.1 3-hydroxyisobutyrate dehydrogenase [Labrys wisconsinensis]